MYITAEYVHSVALTLECGHSMAKLSNSYFNFFDLNNL